MYLFFGVHDRVAQEKKRRLNALRACIENMPGSITSRWDTPEWHWKIRLLNYPGKGTTFALVEFFSTQGGHIRKRQKTNEFEIISAYTR